ncbi:MAG TPA: histidine kinase [Pyrinomonadaceae bacterium]|nr:histidine kinase [Pyrinomonadaceae bacterium]
MENFESPVYTFESSAGLLQRSSLVKWSVITGVWILLGLIYVAPIYFEVRAEGMGHSFLKVFSWGILQWLAWAPLTPLIIALARRFPLVGGSWGGSLAVHIPAFILFSALHSAASVAITLTIKPWANMGSSPLSFWPRFVSRLQGSFGADLLIYGAVVGVCYAIDYYRKYREREFVAAQLETQLAQAQLDSLRMQLHPHFLFNTLNGIVGLVRDKKNDTAVTMLVGLSDLLRHALEHSDRQEIELKEELNFIRLYLKIQQMRFSDRLQIQFDIDPETTKALVPNLLLQPLLENALRHGIGRSAAVGSIVIASKKENDRLLIKVTDNGAGLRTDWQLKSSSGIGLANTVARLQQLYGENHRFNIQNRDHGGVEVEVVLPFRVA